MFIRGSHKPPHATRLSKSAEQTVWQVTWPKGKTYRAIVRHADAALLLETWCKAQPVAEATAARIEPAVRKAIATAEAEPKKPARRTSPT